MSRRHRRVAVAAMMMTFAVPAAGQVASPPLADTPLADPARERAARTLMDTLRCLVCQGQSIADSDADMAADMRALVRRRIAAGDRPDDIRDWLIARYGEYVSYDPPLGLGSVLLWSAPVVLLLLGMAIASRSIRGRVR